MDGGEAGQIPRRRGVLPSIALALAGVLAGFLLGSVGAFLQAVRAIGAFGDAVIVVPWGMILVILMLLCVIRGAGALLGSRGGCWAVLAGWLAATVTFALESPSGDVAISGGGRQWIYVLSGTILGAAASTLPVRRLAVRSRPAAVE